MTRADFEQWFQSTGKPWLLRARDAGNRFHQAATDALANPALFWIALFVFAVGAVTLIRWAL